MNKFSLPNETVCAISSPPGIGGIAVIRTSGKDALLIVDSIFSKSLKKSKKLSDLKIKNKKVKLEMSQAVDDVGQIHLINEFQKLFEKKNLLIEASLKKEYQFDTKRLIEMKSYRGLKSIRKKLHSRK